MKLTGVVPSPREIGTFSMECYEELTTEQLEKHREILVWMLGEVALELAKRERLEG